MSDNHHQQKTPGKTLGQRHGENTGLMETLRRELAEKTALLQAITAVSSSLDLTTVLTRLAEQMGQAIEVTSAYITDWNPETGKATVIAEYLAPEAGELERASDLGVAYDVEELLAAEEQARLSQGDPVVSHIDDPNLPAQQRAHMLTYSARSILVVPLFARGVHIGYVDLWESRYRRDFTEAEIYLVRAIANQAAVAIENARLHQETRRQAQELVRLHQALRRQTDTLTSQVAARTAELQSERDRTLVILESAGEGIILTDVNANILYANPALEQQSGYSRAELISRNPHILNSGETPPAVFREMWTTILSGQRWSGEVRNRHKSGRVYDVRVTINPILNQEQEITGFVSVESDISLLKEVDRLKAAFIAHVSHELRTPLTNIKTYVSLLERGQAEKRGRYLYILRHETDRLARLIQDMLDLSRLETEPATDPAATADLRSVVGDLLAAFGTTVKARQIAFRHHVPAALPLIQVGRQHLEQVLNNLLSNAFAYTPVAGQVWLSAGTQREGETLFIRIEIGDNGPGIAPEDKPRLFERFFRGLITLDKGIPGAGLGLAVAKEIVERYRGRIDVTSEPGSGTTFSVLLPAARREQGHDAI